VDLDAPSNRRYVDGQQLYLAPMRRDAEPHAPSTTTI
jgi:hypothetical protein